jgi:hypothetical protein
MRPIVDRLGEEFEDQVTIVQLNAGQPANAELQSQYDLRGHPSFAVLDGDGQVVQRLFGPQAEGVLRQAVMSVASQ